MNDVYYPLTFSQKGIWYTEKLYPGTSIGIVAGTLKIRDKIDFNLLEKAVTEYIRRNDTLRLHFLEIDGEPIQYYSEYTPSNIKTYDFSSEDIRVLYEWDTQRTQTPFSLIDNNLYDIALLKINGNEAGVYIKMHHLICDGWSIVNSGNDIFSIYNDLLSGNNSQVVTPPSYVEFINSENEYKSSEKFSKDREFWNSRFQSYPEPTSLNSRNNHSRSSKARRKSFVLPAKLDQKISEYCRMNRTSIFSLYFSAFSIYLNRVNGIDDITIGVPVLNRSNVREKNTLGMFISTVPVRVSIDNNTNFTDFSNSVSKEWLTVLKHHKYPYDLILKDVRDRYKGLDDLYDITLSYQNAKIIKNDNSNHEGRWHFCGHQKQSLNIHINDRENDGTVMIDYDYLTDIFYAKEIDFLHDHVIRILWHALDNPLKAISCLEMVSEREKKKVLYEFNQSDSDYPSTKTIIQLFEEQVLKTPDNTAIMSENSRISYRQFNERVNELAWAMISAGVKLNDIVAILMPRSMEAVFSIFAVLKCGAAFLSIDPTYPLERIQYILSDSSPKLILFKNGDDYVKTGYEGNWLNVSADSSPTLNAQNNPNIYTDSQSLAYIIYTSGSTGKPKGAMITQKGLVNYTVWAAKVYISGGNIIFPLYSSLSFDLTITSIFTPVITGNCMLIYKEEDNAMTICKVFQENKADIVKLTPAHLNLIKDFDNTKSRIKKLVVGGEELKTELARQVYKSFNGNVEILNEYGPTETVVGCMIYKYDFEMDNRASVPIGVPADNVRIYILDKYLNPVPIGVAGELYIGGDGVCAGYLNKPVLTAEKFLQDPFKKSERIYKSGDLARWFPRGDVEYLGRIDYQVKIKGFRVELGEIENQLLSHESVNEAVVIDWVDPNGKKYLCAYVAANNNIKISDLRAFLQKQLPNYMIPSFFIFLEKIPLSPNGKVDRRSLPEPELTAVNDEFVAPRNDIEIALADAWKNVLGFDKISIDDNPFEMGADSLVIVQIQAKLLKYNWNINTQDFYRYQTIRLLAEKIASENDHISQAVVKPLELKKFTSIETGANKRQGLGNVLITGVTGFLGMHILNEIMNSTDAKVYCLVRGNISGNATENLLNSISFYFGNKYQNLMDKRIFIVKGDITLEKFGLSDTEYDELGNKVTGVIHSGALVKHYGDTNLFKSTNINGTKEAAKFAMNFGIQLNHISTISIAGSYINHSNRRYEFCEDDLYFGQSFGDNIYIKTKFEAEELIINNIKNGLKANIFRIGNLSGRYSDGCFQKNKFDNAFHSRICSIINFGAVPENILDYDIDLTPVDLCSSAIINIIKNYSNKSGIYHMVNSNKITIRKLVYLLNQLGNDITIVDPDKFGVFIKKIYDSDINMQFLYSFINDFNGNSLIYETNVSVNNDKTIKALKDIGFKWPTCDAEYIKKLYGDVKRVEVKNVKDVV